MALPAVGRSEDRELLVLLWSVLLLVPTNESSASSLDSAPSAWARCESNARWNGVRCTP